MTKEQALKLLDLTPEATQDEITKTYRRLAKAVHPDIGGTNGMFALLNEAHEILIGKQTPEPDSGQNASASASAERQTDKQAQQRPRPLTLSELSIRPDFVIPPDLAERIILKNESAYVPYGHYSYNIFAAYCLLYSIAYQLQARLEVKLWKSRIDYLRHKQPVFQTTQNLTFSKEHRMDTGLHKHLTMKNFHKGFMELVLTGYDASDRVTLSLRENKPAQIRTMTILPKGVYPPHMNLDLTFEQAGKE